MSCEIEIWFVRHGETIDNANHVLQGQKPGKLSEQGISQAKLTGIRLVNENFDEIFCSDLGRAKETLECIISPRKDKETLKVNYSHMARERAFGIFEGLPTIVYREMVEKSGISFKDYKPKGGESWNDFHERAEQFVEFLVKRCLDIDKDRSIDTKRVQDEDESRSKEEGTEDKSEEEIKEGESPKKGVKISALGSIEPRKDTNSENKVKILVVSHKGFLTEIFNIFNSKILGHDGAQSGINNCSISVLKMTREKNGEMKFNFVEKNGITHLNPCKLEEVWK